MLRLRTGVFPLISTSAAAAGRHGRKPGEAWATVELLRLVNQQGASAPPTWRSGCSPRIGKLGRQRVAAWLCRLLFYKISRRRARFLYNDGAHCASKGVCVAKKSGGISQIEEKTNRLEAEQLRTCWGRIVNGWMKEQSCMESRAPFTLHKTPWILNRKHCIWCSVKGSTTPEFGGKTTNCNLLTLQNSPHSFQLIE